MGLLESWWKIF